MFNIGDNKVICIDVSFRETLEFLDEIELGGIYEVSLHNSGRDYLRLKNKSSSYKKDRFISVAEDRRRKIQKIKNNVRTNHK